MAKSLGGLSSLSTFRVRVYATILPVGKVSLWIGRSDGETECFRQKLALSKIPPLGFRTLILPSRWAFPPFLSRDDSGWTTTKAQFLLRLFCTVSTSFARSLILSHSQIAALSRVSIRASPSAASSSSPPGKNVIRLSSLLSLPPTSPCRLPLPPTSSSFFSQPLLPPYDGWRLSPPLFCEAVAAADPPSLPPSLPSPLAFLASSSLGGLSTHFPSLLAHSEQPRLVSLRRLGEEAAASPLLLCTT